MWNWVVGGLIALLALVIATAAFGQEEGADPRGPLCFPPAAHNYCENGGGCYLITKDRMRQLLNQRYEEGFAAGQKDSEGKI